MRKDNECKWLLTEKSSQTQHASVLTNSRVYENNNYHHCYFCPWINYGYFDDTNSQTSKPFPVDTTEPFMVHELPPPHSGVGTTSKYAGEVTKIDGASDEENVAELTHDTTATDTSVQTLKYQTIPRVQLDVEGCENSSAAPPQSTINRICSTYTTDGEYVYFHDTRMSADAATFAVYPVSVQQYVSPNTADLLFAHDAYTVYFQDQALMGVTPETFKVVATNGTEDEIRQFKDKVRLLAEQNPSLQRVEIYLGKPVTLDKYAYLDELVNRLLILDTNLVPFEGLVCAA
jgi:hypothetical protein